MYEIQARLITEAQRSSDSLISCSASPFLQSAFWADFKALHGWKSVRFELSVLHKVKTKTQKTLFGLSVLLRTFKHFFSIAYIPMGPVFPFEQTADARQYYKLLTAVAAAIKPLLPQNTFCLRMDVPLNFYSRSKRDDFVKSLVKPLVKPPTDIQPPDTTVLDLSLSEEKLLAKMKPKWRYNIRLAEKKGVTVRKCGENGIDVFYALYEQTAKRDRIAIHRKDYYRNLLRLAGESSFGYTCTVHVYIAEHEGEYLAALIALFSPAEAVYLYGASSDTKRNLMSPYLLQWTAIRDAKKAGCKIYDFYGIPPGDDENHPMHGLYRFKIGFGGTIIHRAGSIDIPLSPLYRLFATAEYMRSFYHKRLKKLLVRR